jgi:hypothetical protein
MMNSLNRDPFFIPVPDLADMLLASDMLIYLFRFQLRTNGLMSITHGFSMFYSNILRSIK